MRTQLSKSLNLLQRQANYIILFFNLGAGGKSIFLLGFFMLAQLLEIKCFQVYEQREENISFYEPLYMLSKYTIFSWLKYFKSNKIRQL